jgi:hypothetical protein
MTIPYLPGWWDEINRGGAAEKFVGGLDRRMRPNAYAQQSLQQMVSQNPAVLEQISNMDEGQRALFAQAMGFTNPNAFSNLMPGPALAQRQEQERAIAGLTPDQTSERASKIAGVRPQEEITRARIEQEQKDLAFNQDLETGKVNLQILTAKGNEIKRLEGMIQQGLDKYGTVENMPIRSLVRDFVRSGRDIDPLQSLVISQHPGAASLFDAAVKLELQTLQNEAQRSIATMRNPAENQIFLKSLTELGNQLNDAESRLLAEKSQWTNNISNFGKPWPLETQLAKLREERARNTKLSQALANKLANQEGINPIAPPDSAGVAGAAGASEAARILDEFRNRRRR